jgi:hypothetical protein
MKICRDHWHELRNAIRQRGLWGYVSPNGYLPNHITERELTARPTQAPLDPLMATSLMISEQAVLALGPQLLHRPDCPLCEVEQNLGKGLSLEWIDADADMILQVCRQRNMVGLEQ